MAAQKKWRPARADNRADQPVSAGKVLSSLQHQDYVAPAIYGLFFLFLFLCCSPALDSKFDLPKSLILYMGVIALGIRVILRNWRISGVSPNRSALLLSLVLGIWWIVSTLFAIHIPTALNGVFDHYYGLWRHLCWLSLFVASMVIPADMPTIRRITTLLVAAIVPVAIVNISEISGLTTLGLDEVTTLGDRVAASALMNFAIPFAAIALARTRHGIVKAGLGCLLALLVLSELLSQGRGPWIGLVVSIVILVVGLVRSKAAWKAVAAILVGIVMLAGLAASMNPTVSARFATLTRITHDWSLGQRFVYYQAALRATREHPVTGIGFENFQNIYPLYRTAEDRLFFQDRMPTMVHNGYLQTALTNGIPALLLYLALIVTVMTILIRKLLHEEDRDKKDLLLGFLAALTAYLVQDLSGWLDIGLASAFWIMLGLALNLAGQNTRRSPWSWTKPVIVTFSGLMIVLSLYLMKDGYSRLLADSDLFEAQSLEIGREWPKTESLVCEALMHLPEDSRTEMVAGHIYAKRFVAHRDPRAYARSRELLESSYHHNPFDRLRLSNIILLEIAALEVGRIAAPSDFAQKAIQILSGTDRDNPGFHEVRAKFFAAQGRFDEALTAILVARRLSPQEKRFWDSEAEYRAKMQR